MQLTFPFAPEATRPKRPRRCRWQAELARQSSFFDDRLARAAARHQQELARVDRQIADLRDRVADIERGEGAADLARAPVRRAELRAFAR